MFPHVSTEALLCALVLAEEGNLGRAGDRLHTSKSNVSRKVTALQKGWGVDFFRRTARGFELTDEARPTLREIRRALEQVQRSFDHATYITVRNRRPVRIGYSLYVHGKVLPFLQGQNLRSSRFSRVVLKADTTTHLKRQVLRGDLHIGFGVMPIVDKDLQIEFIEHEYFGVCVPATHRLKDKVRLSVRDLANETIFWMPRSVHPPFYDEVTDYLHGAGIHSHNLQEARAIIQGIDLAASQLGVALVPQSAARFQCPGVLFKPLTDKLIRIETVLFVRKDQMKGDVRDRVEQMLAELRPPKVELP